MKHERIFAGMRNKVQNWFAMGNFSLFPTVTCQVGAASSSHLAARSLDCSNFWTLVETNGGLLLQLIRWDTHPFIPRL